MKCVFFLLMKKYKVMFVCMGNICRSPLAHGVFQKMVEDEGLESHIEIESSGTTAYHIGELPDYRMTKVAASRGFDLNHRARKFMPSDLENYDMVLAMDNNNLRDIQMHQKKHHQASVQLFRNFDPEGVQGSEVPDPYYGGDEGFENVFRIVHRTSRRLLDHVKNELDLT